MIDRDFQKATVRERLPALASQAVLHLSIPYGPLVADWKGGRTGSSRQSSRRSSELAFLSLTRMRMAQSIWMSSKVSLGVVHRALPMMTVQDPLTLLAARFRKYALKVCKPFFEMQGQVDMFEQFSEAVEDGSDAEVPVVTVLAPCGERIAIAEAE